MLGVHSTRDFTQLPQGNCLLHLTLRRWHTTHECCSGGTGGRTTVVEAAAEAGSAPESGAAAGDEAESGVGSGGGAEPAPSVDDMMNCQAQ